MRRSRRTAALLASLAGLGAGAALAPLAAAQDAPASRLVPFASCEDLLAHVREHLPRPVPYDPNAPIPSPMPMPTAPPTADRGGSEGLADEPDWSGTNVQEAGVDEPDIVKTDGRRIFAIAGGRLHEVDARAERPRVLGTLRLSADATHQLLIDGDRAIVIAQEWDRGDVGVPEPVPTPRPAAGSPRAAGAAGTRAGDAARGRTASPPARAAVSPARYMGRPRTVLTELDLSLRGRPRIVRTLRFDGSVRAARMVDGMLRVVSTSSPLALVEQEARDEVGGWIPEYRLRNRRTGRTATRPVSACAQVSRPERFAGLDLLTILTIDVRRGLTPIDSESMLSDVGDVYASPTSLYVSTPYDWSAGITQIHAYAADGREATRYRASGAVQGDLLSQWALSERDGVLRVASTQQARTSTDQSESFVTTLRERDGRLEQLARVGGLGRGERIYAVRFIGDVGYVVTFRQVDPLYTLDLADPRRPRLLGELKIPGYSAYLHPVGEDLLLGVGQDATEEGRRLGASVSLFDVSDLRRPTRLAQERLPGWSSQVEWNHHAFLYWPRTRLAVIPGQGLGPDQRLAGATGFQITRRDGLRRVATMRHPYDSYGGEVQRSLVVGRRLFTLSDHGLLASDLATLRDGDWLDFGER